MNGHQGWAWSAGVQAGLPEYACRLIRAFDDVAVVPHMTGPSGAH